MFKNLNIIPLICLVIIFVSLQGFFNNYGLASRTLVTTSSAIVVLFIGVVVTYGLLTRQKWSPTAFAVWMGYGVINNIVYFLVFKNRPLWSLAVAAVVVFILTVVLMKKLQKDIEPPSEKPDDDSVQGSR